MTYSSTTASQPGFTEVELDRTEQQLDIAGFLAIFPAAFFVACPWPIFFVFLPPRGMGTLGGLILPLVVTGICCGMMLLWGRAISRLSPVAVVLTTSLLALVVFAAAGRAIGAVGNIDDLVNGLDDVAWLMLIAPCFVPIYFSLSLIWAGWRLARTPKPLRQYLVTVHSKPGSFRQSLLRALGIPQSVEWLSRGVRRTLAIVSFVLRSLVLGYGLFMMLAVFLDGAGYFAMASGPFCIYNAVRGIVYEDLPPGFCTRAGIVSFFPIASIALVGISFLLLFAARRLVRLSLEDLVEIDKRPPVLFLRSFKDDQVVLQRPRRPFFRWLFGLGEPAAKLDHVLVEEGTKHGPVVAIGAPRTPPPFGAARTYASDHEWQQAVTDLARAASAIAIVADDTEGVLWELAMIRREGLAPKTIYFLPPVLAHPREATRIIGREVMAAGIRGDEIAASLGRLVTPCIGWLLSSAGHLTIFTTRRPSRASYVCALRMALDS